MELYSWCVQVPGEEKTRSVVGNDVSKFWSPQLAQCVVFIQTDSSYIPSPVIDPSAVFACEINIK